MVPASSFQMVLEHYMRPAAGWCRRLSRSLRGRRALPEPVSPSCGGAEAAHTAPPASLAAVMVFCISMVMVITPTPPGTGVR